jgi:uncharacterized protein (TIGR03435 family)
MTGSEWALPTSLLSAVGNHLWQSTLVFVTIWGLTRLLRHHRAAVRHALWLVATLKFLVPFDALTALGRQFGTGISSVNAQPIVDTIQLASTPFSLPVTDAVAAGHLSPAQAAPTLLVSILVLVWAAGTAMMLIRWLVSWVTTARLAVSTRSNGAGCVASALATVQARIALRTPVNLAVCHTRIEPGVFGVWTPLLLWPAELTARLSIAEIEAIIAHELVHVRRRDNLTGAMHAFVQAMFWFHPALWWTGRELRAERERACDEAVLAFGYAPRTYAESIVKTCEFCIPASAVAATGVTGSLRTRVADILQAQVGTVLGHAHRVALVMMGASAVTVPFLLGLVSAPHLRAQTPARAGEEPAFELASVKPNTSGDGQFTIGIEPGGRLTALNVTLRDLIRAAYQVQSFQIVGAPAWLTTDRFDILAKAESEFSPGIPPLPGAPPGMPQQMLQALLRARFTLDTHIETREMPIYDLVPTRRDGSLGDKLRPSSLDCAALATRRWTAAAPAPGSGGVPDCGIRIGPGFLSGKGMPMPLLANSLSQMVQRVVIDHTGLSGSYAFEVVFTPDRPQPDSGMPPETPSSPPGSPEISLIDAAVQEQLGLKLENAHGLVPVLVIDHAELPTPD